MREKPHENKRQEVKKTKAKKASQKEQQVITKMVNFFIVSKSKKWVNQFMGFSFGFLKGSVVLSMFVWVLDLLPNEKWSEIIIQKSYLANNLKSARVQIIKSFHWEDPTLQGEKFIKEIITLEKKETS